MGLFKIRGSLKEEQKKLDLLEQNMTKKLDLLTKIAAQNSIQKSRSQPQPSVSSKIKTKPKHNGEAIQKAQKNELHYKKRIHTKLEALEKEKKDLEEALKNQHKKANEKIMRIKQELKESTQKYTGKHEKGLRTLLNQEKEKNERLREEIKILEELKSKKQKEVTTKLRGATQSNRQNSAVLERLKQSNIILEKENGKIKELLQAEKNNGKIYKDRLRYKLSQITSTQSEQLTKKNKEKIGEW